MLSSRHPQYLGLAIIGLGAFVVWPRVLVRIMYVTMLFLYGLLARREEARCLEKFGGAYREYRSRTGMFFPWPLPRVIPWPAVGRPRTLARFSLYVVAVAATLGLGCWLCDYALSRLSAYYADGMAVRSPARLTSAELRAAIRVATSAAEIRQRIESARSGALIVFVLPEAWQTPTFRWMSPRQRVRPRPIADTTSPPISTGLTTACSSHAHEPMPLRCGVQRLSRRHMGSTRSSWSA
jgi:hypothetical protein